MMGLADRRLAACDLSRRSFRVLIAASGAIASRQGRLERTATPGEAMRWACRLADAYRIERGAATALSEGLKAMILEGLGDQARDILATIVPASGAAVGRARSTLESLSMEARSG